MDIKITTIFLLVIIYSPLFSQNAYIAKDSAYSYGVTIIEGIDFSNSLICKVKKGKNEIEYTPDELTEYGTENGRIYISKELNIHGFSKKYFIERLVKGNINLYYLKLKKGKLFFIEKDSSVFEIIKKNDSIIGKGIFKNDLMKYCTDTDAVKHTKYKKEHLKLLINRQNSGIIKPFPFAKFGIFTGVSATKILSAKNTSLVYTQNLNSKLDYNLTLGAFLDIPISLSNTSFHPEIYYTQNAFSETIENDSTVNDLLIKFSSINIPLLFRYTYPSKKIRPFANLGLIYSYHKNYEQEIFSSTYEVNTVYFEKVNTENLLSQKQIGYSGGIGLQYNLNYRKSLYLEIRYSKQYGIPDFDTVKKSQFHFITGFNF